MKGAPSHPPATLSAQGPLGDADGGLGISETCSVKSRRPRGCQPRLSPAVREGPCRTGKHRPQHPWAPRGTSCAGHSTLVSAHTPSGHGLSLA